MLPIGGRFGIFLAPRFPTASGGPPGRYGGQQSFQDCDQFGQVPPGEPPTYPGD